MIGLEQECGLTKPVDLMLKWIKSLFAKPEPVQFVHPDFGVFILEADMPLWEGQLNYAGRSISICFGGTRMAPDVVLLARAKTLVGKLDEVERKAKAFICSSEDDIKEGHLTLASIDFLWENKPDIYALEFSLEGDGDGIWRIEFDGDKPTHTGRDD